MSIIKETHCVWSLYLLILHLKIIKNYTPLRHIFTKRIYEFNGNVFKIVEGKQIYYFTM